MLLCCCVVVLLSDLLLAILLWNYVLVTWNWVVVLADFTQYCDKCTMIYVCYVVLTISQCMYNPFETQYQCVLCMGNTMYC